jgi:tRNA (cytidine/uridine-2'-O-)-methyltransferase
MLHVVLVEPEIPPNTGNVGRLCLATGAHLHLVKPLGFSLDDKLLKRAGLDYWREVQVTLWDSFAALTAAQAVDQRYWFLTTKAMRAYWDAEFRDGDFLVFGRETKGLPESLLAAHPGARADDPNERSHPKPQFIDRRRYRALRSRAPDPRADPEMD